MSGWSGQWIRPVRCVPQVVDLLLLAHDDVLEEVLERLAPRFLSGVRDHRMQAGNRSLLVLHQGVERTLGIG